MTRTRTNLVILGAVAFLLLAAGTAAAQGPTVTVEPAEGLVDGDTVTVTVTGFPTTGTDWAGVQCVLPIDDPLEECSDTGLVPVEFDAEGAATFEFTVMTGAIGSGTCGVGGDSCAITVGSLEERFARSALISFEDGELALTGAKDVAALSALALGLVILGYLLLMRSKKPVTV